MQDNKVADLASKTPSEDFTDVTVAIGDTYGDNVRCNDVGAGLAVDKVVQLGD